MAKKSLTYRIGDHVKVDMTKEVRVIYEKRINSKGVKQDYKTLIKADEEFAKQSLSPMPKDIRKGVITGMKMICNGWHYRSYQSSPSYFDPVGDYEPGGIDVQEIVYLWCIRFGYMNKEHYFKEEDITRFLNTPSQTLTRPMFIPFKDTGWNSSQADQARENMKREVKSYPRDKKGRFVK